MFAKFKIRLKRFFRRLFWRNEKILYDGLLDISGDLFLILDKTTELHDKIYELESICEGASVCMSSIYKITMECDSIVDNIDTIVYEAEEKSDDVFGKVLF